MLLLPLIRWSASTNLKCGACKTEGSLCNWMELQCIRVILVGFYIGERTSVSTAPYLITLSKALSVDLFINGEYFSNNSLSSWSIKCRDSAYLTIISWLWWVIAKRWMVAFTENLNSRGQLYCPTMTISTFLYQNWAHWYRQEPQTDLGQWVPALGRSNNYWKDLEGQHLC